jgi:hypothetical protein
MKPASLPDHVDVVDPAVVAEIDVYCVRLGGRGGGRYRPSGDRRHATND